MKRLPYIDQLKGFGILAVLFLHTVGYIRNALPYTDVSLWRLEAWLHSFLMPFFVFVSGFSFYHFYLKPRTTNNAYIYIYIYIYIGYCKSTQYLVAVLSLAKSSFQAIPLIK